jgi:hypothetical protein
MGVTEEASKAVGGFVTVMGSQPLALALVVMNLTLLGYLFYIQSSTNNQRKETVDLIVKSQNETEKLLANCVSGEVTRTMLDNMQRITETMLSAEQKEILRMQDAINAERSRSWELREREKKELDELKGRRKEQPQEQSQPKAQRLSSDVPFIPLPPLPDDIYLPPLK